MAQNDSSIGYIGNIETATLDNPHFREALFTGNNLQMTVMNIPPGGEVGLEMHDDLDQFLRIESGKATVTLGPAEDQVDETHEVGDDWAIIVPGGVWHNVINAGDEPLKLYSLYSPPEHPAGTIHETKAESDAAEAEHHH
ncbi:MAG: cupin domain-containing protein [Acidimicrobiales bacterium]|nr:cupin domain-containing protein [Acidimicrobiales bacterium]